MSLDLLGADLIGEAGDVYLRAHSEIARDPSGVPVRGVLVPLSAEEKAEYERLLGKAPPAVVYRGPSLNELKRRDPAGYNDAERYWVASIEGDIERAQGYMREAELALQRDMAQIDTREARAETEHERKRRELAEDEQAGWDPFKGLGEAGGYVKAGVAVAAIGVGAIVIKKVFW